jgi:hypothetical protein
LKCSEILLSLPFSSSNNNSTSFCSSFQVSSALSRQHLAPQWDNHVHTILLHGVIHSILQPHSYHCHASDQLLRSLKTYHHPYKLTARSTPELSMQSVFCSTAPFTFSHHCSDTKHNWKRWKSPKVCDILSANSHGKKAKTVTHTRPPIWSTPSPLKVVFSPLRGHSGVAPTQKRPPMTRRVWGVKSNEPISLGAFFKDNNCYWLISAINNL